MFVFDNFVQHLHLVLGNEWGLPTFSYHHIEGSTSLIVKSDRSWPAETHSEIGIVLSKNPSRNPNSGLENAFTYAIWNVKEIENI